MNILLVEDQAMVRGALTALLNLENDIQVLATAANGIEAQQLLQSMQSMQSMQESTNQQQSNAIDLVVTDIQMPECDGLTLCQAITTHYPNIRVVILTTFARAGYLTKALKAGAEGFLLKDSPSQRLAAALRDVYEGRKVIDAELALTALDSQNSLTPKEREALALAQQGLNTAAIAKTLCLSKGTVRNYLSEAISKLGASNRIDAARKAQEKGWL